jgi:hypothetical protein
MNDGANEDEIEIDELTVELPEGDDPLAGQAMAQQVIRRLAELLGEWVGEVNSAAFVAALESHSDGKFPDTSEAVAGRVCW